MTISSVSFWQQDQNFWQQSQSQSNSQAADTTLINVMAQAETNLGKGLASIANSQALQRVNSQIVAEVQSALQGSSGSSTPTSSSSSTSSSSTSASSTSSSSSTGTASSSAAAAPKYASSTGTVPVTTTTTLSSLGFLPGGTINVGDGTHVTNYRSTGSDTIGDLVNAINSGSAFVTASINSSGKLVITARDQKMPVVISGSGIDATAIGFGNGNNTFEPPSPTAAATPTASTSPAASSTTTTPSSSASTASSKSSSPSTAAVPTLNSEMTSSAASLLSASGAGGTLVDMLA
jgi:hypothetical protein